MKKTNWPLLGLAGPTVRYLLMTYLIGSMLFNGGLFWALIALTPAKALTPGVYVFIIWLSAIMLNISSAAAVVVVIAEHLQREILDILEPPPTRVILETRPGELP